MATIRLVPSAYTRSSTNRVSVSNPENMYYNTDHTGSYCTIRGRNSSSNTYYCFIHGFDFSDVPSNASVTAFKVKIKCYRSSTQNTGTSYNIRLASQASSSYVISNTTTSTAITTDSAGETIEIPTSNLSWSTLSGYGSGFSIDVVLRSTDGSYPYVYVYGAEIEVTYTLPNPRTVTSTLSGNGTLDPSGATATYDGEDYTLKITPTNTSQPVTVTNNGTDVTSSVITHYVPGQATTDNRVLGTYTLVSGGFNGSGASYFSGLVGKGHTSSTTSSNYYSSGSSTIAVFTYDISFTLPAGAVVTNLYVMVSGHAESTSQSSEYMCAEIISGSTALSDELNFKSIGTSNSTQTITAHTMPTVEQVANLKLQCRLGYYGGALNGATCYIEYEIPKTEIEYYTYTYEVNGDATIAVVIGTPGPSTATIYYKNNGTWVAAVAVYKKVNGSWVQQTNLSNVFDANTNYVKG